MEGIESSVFLRNRTSDIKTEKVMSNEQKFLIESMISDMASYLIDDNGLSVLEALDVFLIYGLINHSKA